MSGRDRKRKREKKGGEAVVFVCAACRVCCVWYLVGWRMGWCFLCFNALML